MSGKNKSLIEELRSRLGGDQSCAINDDKLLDDLKRKLDKLSLLEDVLDDMDMAVLVNDSEGRYLYTNRKALRHAGQENGKMEEKLPSDFYPPDVSSLIENANCDVLNSQSSQAYEHEMFNDGRLHNVHKGYLENQHVGEIVYTVARDVTEQRDAEKERQFYRDILFDALNAIPEGFVVYDNKDRLVLCNNAYIEIYKTSAPVLKPGKTFREILEFGLEHGQYPQAGRTKETQNKWIEQRLTAHRNPKGAIVQKTDEGMWLHIDERVTEKGYIVGIRADITDLKNAQERLKEQRDQLEFQATELRKLSKENIAARLRAEEATQAKSNFLALISHELRTPMTGILGLTDLLFETQIDNIQKGHLNNLKISADTLLVLLNDVLDYSKFEAGQVKFEKTDFDFTETAQNVIELLKPNADDKGLKLKLDLDDTSLHFVSDPTRIRQVLLNFTANAIKFTEKGSVTIKARFQENTQNLLVEVIDTGIGIESGKGDVLFQPFVQAEESTTRKFGGTGLGLSICKMIVKGLEGQIGYDSEIGKGAVFWFSLPLKRGQKKQSGNERLNSKSDIAGRFNFQRTLTILLAEDNQINRTVISTVLKRIGHVVVEVENGQEAVDATSADKFDVVLMDMNMPVMDGAEATRLIKHKIPSLPIIALTADVQAAGNENYTSSGIDAFVPKPVDWELLEKVIKDIVFKKSS